MIHRRFVDWKFLALTGNAGPDFRNGRLLADLRPQFGKIDLHPFRTHLGLGRPSHPQDKNRDHKDSHCSEHWYLLKKIQDTDFPKL